MKSFAGVGGVNGLLNEASLPEFIMKISEERENYYVLTRGPSRDVYKHTCTNRRELAIRHKWATVLSTNTQTKEERWLDVGLKD